MSYKIKNKQLDLLAAYNRNDKPSRMSASLKFMIVPIVLVLVFASIFAFMTIITLDKKNQTKTINEDAEVIQLKIDATDKTPYEELQKMETALASIETIDSSLSALPEITKNKIQYIKKDLIAGMTISSISFDQSTKLITVSLMSNNVQNIEKYIGKLKLHAEYSDVEYTGYSEKTTTTTTDSTNFLDQFGNPTKNVTSSSGYSFQVKINIDEGAGE
ncbi:MAG: hypothetical protein RR558_00265 [Coprobacillus sp.]